MIDFAVWRANCLNANKLTVTVALFFFLFFSEITIFWKGEEISICTHVQFKKKDLKFSMIMSQMTLAKMVGWMGLLMHDAFTIKKQTMLYTHITQIYFIFHI